MSKKWTSISFVMFLSVILLITEGRAAAVSKLNRVRSWQHRGYTRLVLDAEGAQPLKIGPATAKDLVIVFEQLELMQPPSVLFRNLTGAVAGANHNRHNNRSVIAIKFKDPDTAVKSFYLSGKSAKKGAYRLIMDFYPPGSVATGPGAIVPVVSVKTAIPKPAPATAPAATPPPRIATASSKTSLPAAESSQQFAEFQFKDSQTAPTSPAERVDLASGVQKQEVPPAESPTRTSKEGEEQSLSRLHRSENTSQMGVKEPSANRDEFRGRNDQTIAVLKGEIPMVGKAAQFPAAQAPQSGISPHAVGAVDKTASGVPAQDDLTWHFINPEAMKKKTDTTGRRTPIGIEARSEYRYPAVGENAIPRRSKSYERNDPRSKLNSMGLVELTLKILSIALSCLVILFLHRANKIAKHRYHALKQIQQNIDNQRPPAELRV